MKIDAQITILASYNNNVHIIIHDKTSGTAFVELELTNEQFVNATMNRLGNTDVMSAEVQGMDRVGKTHEYKPLEFPITKWRDADEARSIVGNYCPEGWIPDMGFNNQATFFEKEGKRYARTTIRRWV